MPVISKISNINLLPLLINLFATYAFRLFENKFDNKFLIWFDNTFEINLTSTLSKDIGFQFFKKLLSLSFFSVSFIAACFWEVISSFYRNAILNDRRRGTLTWSQKASWNSLVRPSFQGDLLISILFNSCFTSSLVISFSLRAHWSSFSFRRFLFYRNCNNFCLEISLFLEKIFW